MPKYTVTASRFRKVTGKGDDRVMTRYRQGDTVELTTEDAERLLVTGGLVPFEEPTPETEVEPADLSEQGFAGPTLRDLGEDLGESPRTPGALSGQTADEGLQDTTGATGKPTPPSGEPTPEPEASGSPTTPLPDKYDSMDYADLQQAAKDAGLNSGGSAADIKARLRMKDAEQA